MTKITSINGILVAPLEELNEHVEDGTVHVTEEECKAWNGKQDKLMDENGNMTLNGGVTATIGWFNGPLHAGDPAGTSENERFNSIYGDTWFHGQVEFRHGAVLNGGLWMESGAVKIGTQASMTVNGAATFSGAVNANGGVCVPAPATAQEALFYDTLTEQQAEKEWKRLGHCMEAQIPSWVTTLIREMRLNGVVVRTANATMQEGGDGDDQHDFLVTMTTAAGVSVIGRSTAPWKFSRYIGDYLNTDYSTACTWRIHNSVNVSVLLGSTTHGYGTTGNPAAACYAHPIHWVDYDKDGMDYRYPLDNTVNVYTNREMTPAWQVTTYGRSYLGSTASCLLRGTDYGRDWGDQQYMWALLPPPVNNVQYVTVAMAPRQSVDHVNVVNRWALFVDGHYVMPMTALFCGSGHTSRVTAKVKAHEVSRTLKTGLCMAGMRVDTGQLPGSTKAIDMLGSVVMDGATVKPVPEVGASAQEVPAEGGKVTLEASSALPEALYVLNDTMCGHDPAAVWCTQSAEEMPAGGGQITLTLAANTTGQPRQVWAFVGHHYAQAAVVKINQSA